MVAHHEFDDDVSVLAIVFNKIPLTSRSPLPWSYKFKSRKASTISLCIYKDTITRLHGQLGIHLVRCKRNQLFPGLETLAWDNGVSWVLETLPNYVLIRIVEHEVARVEHGSCRSRFGKIYNACILALWLLQKRPSVGEGQATLLGTRGSSRLAVHTMVFSGNPARKTLT